jgi:hypothetical protein
VVAKYGRRCQSLRLEQNFTTPINFQQYKSLIENETGHIYMKLVVDIAVEFEKKAPYF